MVEQIPWAKLGRKDLASALLPDPVRGGLWLGFLQGGVAYFKDGQVRASYAGADGLGEGRVSGLQLDRDGTLWAATEGGLSRVKNGRVATLTSKNGLPCDTVHWMMEDDDHSFWLYMACGLVRIARAELDAWVADPGRTIQATVFDSSDGVRSHAIASGYSPRVAKSADGKMWFLPVDGVSVIDPRHLPFNKLPPPVHIEQITADRKTYEASSNLRLPPLVRDLEIDYTALSLVAPEKNRFAYKLEGQDRDWKDVGNGRKAFYNDLPPRNYRFRVIACNNSGVWNEAGACFRFFHRSGVLSDRLVPGVVRGRFSAVALGAVPAPPASDRAGIQRAPGRAGRRAHAHRPRTARHAAAEFSGADAALSGGGRFASAEGSARKNWNRALERADQAIAEGRDAVHDLRSSAMVTNDLAQAVKALGDELAVRRRARLSVWWWKARRGICIRSFGTRFTGLRGRRCAMLSGTPRAQHMEAEITYGERVFRVRIRDDGQGIDPAIVKEGRPGHYGLPGMRERAGANWREAEYLERRRSRHGDRAEHSGVDRLRQSRPVPLAAIPEKGRMNP